MNRVDGFDFWVEDKETGEQVIADDVSYRFPDLCQCDIEGFAITDEGRLIICDECGNFKYLNMDEERYIVHKGGEEMTTDDAIAFLNTDDFESAGFAEAIGMAIQALTRQRLEEHDIGMFCPNCRCGVHKHIYNTDNKPFEVRFCPFCGEKLEWE